MKKIISLLGGRRAGLIAVIDALIFGVCSYFFRVEFLAWRALPLIGLLAALCGVSFSLIPLTIAARKSGSKLLRAFLLSLAAYEIVLWAILTAVNVNGKYNRLAIGVAFGVVLTAFGILCLILFNRMSREDKKTLRRIAGIALLAVFIVGAVCPLFLEQTLQPQIAVWLHGGEQSYFEEWSPDTAFTREYCAEIEKDPDRDFVVLNMSDIQLTDAETRGEEGEIVKKTADELVERTRPDLITLSGDNAWDSAAYLWMIRLIDSYGIPWAPVMGNHDGQGCPSEFWCAYEFTRAKNCLFKMGPAGMGYGNYIINITQNGEIIHTLFMMDTHSQIERDNINGPASDSNYDHLWSEQFEWYSWAVDGISSAAGRTVESTAIMHIPVYEYKLAWETATGVGDWESDKDAPYVGEYADTSFGVRHEYGGWAPQSNGFFDLVKLKGSTKNLIAGHDHVCDYSILYEGVRLTYSVKTGPGCYWEKEINGGTLITIDSNGSATVSHELVEVD